MNNESTNAIIDQSKPRVNVIPSPDRNTSGMYVEKRDGKREPVMFDKITQRLNNLCENIEPKLPEEVDTVIIAQKVVSGVYKGVKTSELDNLAAETAAYMSTNHPGYGDLAGRIILSNLQKQCPKTFGEAADLMYGNVNTKTGERAPLLSEEIYGIINKNRDMLNSIIRHDKDFYFDYFGCKTLQRSYLIKIIGRTDENGNKVNDVRIVETPQYMYLRVSLGIHGDDLESVKRCYELMSDKKFIHGTPAMYNAGTPWPQMSSCFLLTMTEDSIDGIYDTLKRCALVSKSAGGIGLSVHCIRGSNSYIKGTNGNSNGLVPMLRVYNDTARYVDQGGGKRKGAFAIYLEPWHTDIFDFLDLKKNTGKEENRARDLFYALWIPDLFMKRVENNEDWCLFCPNEAPGLDDTWGEKFEKLYTNYETQPHLIRKKVKAQDLWFAIIESQIETGTPYMLYKDSCNRKSNQQNLGTIRSSNLCCEIIEYTSPDEVAVCNLASIGLPEFVTADNTFDHQGLFDVEKQVVYNLNKIIDRNHYPLPEAKYSNFKHRPVATGVQGLANVFARLKLPFDSEGAMQLNKDIFETIYFAALTASCELAKRDGHYETYPGSPISKGIFQFDMWGVKPSSRWDWDTLRENISKHGVRNSLLVAPMPTASTAQILGNNECFEPFTSCIGSRSVLAGTFAVVCRELVDDLMKLGLWSVDMKNRIIGHKGSIQNIAEIPDNLKAIYKTVWEISQRTLINMSADRGAFIDHSQSFNVFIAEPTFQKLTSMHFYAWKKGLKTGMYYLRTLSQADADMVTVDKKLLKTQVKQMDIKPTPTETIKLEGDFCTMQDGCLSCGA